MNPWLQIPLADYEGHMALPSIAQAQMLGGQLESLALEYLPSSVALVGCAGGNGLEQLNPEKVTRVVAIDINPDYVRQTVIRHSQRFDRFEPYCVDVQSERLAFGSVDLIFAPLIFEYVDVSVALRELRRNCHESTILAAVLQLPGTTHEQISPSAFAGVRTLASSMHLVPPEHFRSMAVLAGFIHLRSAAFRSPAGKPFCLEIFRS